MISPIGAWSERGCWVMAAIGYAVTRNTGKQTDAKAQSRQDGTF